MSEAKHTPGPWQVMGCRYKWRDAARDHLLDSHAVGPDGDALCLVFYTDKYHGEQLANAKLIAASPDLIAAAKLAREFNCKHAPALMSLPGFEHANSALFAAITKATAI